MANTVDLRGYCTRQIFDCYKINFCCNRSGAVRSKAAESSHSWTAELPLYKAKRMDVVCGKTAGVKGQLWILLPVLFVLQAFEAFVGVILLKTAIVDVIYLGVLIPVRIGLIYQPPGGAKEKNRKTYSSIEKENASVENCYKDPNSISLKKTTCGLLGIHQSSR